MYIDKRAMMSCCPTVLYSYTESDSLGCTTASVSLRILHCILCLLAALAAWLWHSLPCSSLAACLHAAPGAARQRWLSVTSCINSPAALADDI